MQRKTGVYRVGVRSPWPCPRGPPAGPGAGADLHTGSAAPPFSLYERKQDRVARFHFFQAQYNTKS